MDQNNSCHENAEKFRRNIVLHEISSKSSEKPGISLKFVCVTFAQYCIFVFSIKLMKSVVSFTKDCCFCAIGWSNVSTNEDIRSVGPSQPKMMGLPTGLGLWIFVSV